VHLKALTLKGFKSFPERTRVELGPGTSVIVGPNGSGKSNITDAILWVLGEQSPTAVRGKSMQDIIFAGGRGVKASRSAEVEMIFDNSDGVMPYDFPEVAISRSLDRSGEGEYRINGSKCRLADVIEVLADAGLGKEAHSIVSQGRVEGVVTSKPKDRRLLIEEAAGLGKIRKRRHRAQLKLKRTQSNLDRLLDVEHEARSRLKPLKRQAEAAEIHARLQRQVDEIQLRVLTSQLTDKTSQLNLLKASAVEARGRRNAVELELQKVAEQRSETEESLTEYSRRRELINSQSYEIRSTLQSVDGALAQVKRVAEHLSSDQQRQSSTVERVTEQLSRLSTGTFDNERISQIKAELLKLEEEREVAVEQQVLELQKDRNRQSQRLEQLGSELMAAKEVVVKADQELAAARELVSAAERELDKERKHSAELGGELAAVNQFLRTHTVTPGGRTPLAEKIKVKSGYELALSAALGGVLRSAVVEDITAAHGVLAAAGSDGASAVVLGSSEGSESKPPTKDAISLLELVDMDDDVTDLIGGLLSNVWVVDSIDVVKDSYRGSAVTLDGTVWLGSIRELRKVPSGGSDRVLAQRTRRDQLVLQTEEQVAKEQQAKAALEQSQSRVTALQQERKELDVQQHVKLREVDEARSAVERSERLIQQTKDEPEAGPSAVKKAKLQAELVTLESELARAQTEERECQKRILLAEAKIERIESSMPRVASLLELMCSLRESVDTRLEKFAAEIEEDKQVGQRITEKLRELAKQESELQSNLHKLSEELTTMEVKSQHEQDRLKELADRISPISERLGLDTASVDQVSTQEEFQKLEEQLERINRRREKIGPVNPLAEEEYREALEHTQELESQRQDLESAMRELKSLIASTNRRIKETFAETFEQAAQNFSELVTTLFPGGDGKLVLVEPSEVQSDPDSEELEEEDSSEDLAGVQIQLNPAGKSPKDLSLLSGGEKSLTALAFLFALFLARPCPFYLLDEVEAALDDVNIGRFLELLDRYSSRAQFIVVTHQKRTMEAADYLYGVSMAGNGVSKVISRKLPKVVEATDSVDQQQQLVG